MKQPVFYVTANQAGNYVWTLKGGNGCTICESSRSYARRRDCLRALDSAYMAIFDARVEVLG